MRVAELLMAIFLGLLAVAFMVKSAQLDIGWVDGEGPGPGAFPFWLAAGMLLCCIWIAVRWVLRSSLPAKSTEVFMEKAALHTILVVAVALTAMVGLVHWVGMYVSISLFLLFYLRVLGKHSWALTLSIAAVAPVATFVFFEGLLTKTLPKGITEPWFEPIYRLMYG
ncbi:MAG: tripartite tricarboxylate transporter TctB family protein [Gammaproteobacteria bacterium]|nr:tripartite tricarboxylate transporter TctB family protein [Gammaproteobacteria bacterium]